MTKPASSEPDISETARRTDWPLLAFGCVYAVVVAFAIGQASGFIASESARVGGPERLREPVNVALALGAFWIWLRIAPKARTAKPGFGSPVHALADGLTLGIALPAIALGVLVMSGLAYFEPESAPLDPWIVAAGFGFLCLHSFAEETLMRGVAQRAGEAAFNGGVAGGWAGVLSGGVAFAALQILQGFPGPVFVLNGFLFGCVAGLLARGKGGILSATALHAAWAWLETIVLPRAGSFSVEPGFWGGGGPDSYGSGVFAVVLCAAIAALAVSDPGLRSPSAAR